MRRAVSVGASDDLWAVDVVEPAANIIKAFLDASASAGMTKRDSKVSQRDLWTRYVCQVSNNTKTCIHHATQV